MRAAARVGASEWLFIACGAWLVALGLYFIFIRPPFLPEDTRYIGVDASVLKADAPQLAAWLGKVFTVLGGFMAAAGLLVAYLARMLWPARPRLAGLTLALSGGLTVGLMSAVNFALASDFRWLLLTPVLLWVTACVLYPRRPPPAGHQA